MIRYFESHAHYDDKRFNDRDDLLSRVLPAEGVGRVINIGADMRSSEASIKPGLLRKQQPLFYILYHLKINKHENYKSRIDKARND